MLRPEKVNLEDAASIKVECRRCTCLVSVVEQYTQTTLSARVTCDGEEHEAGRVFEVKPGFLSAVRKTGSCRDGPSVHVTCDPQKPS